MFDTLDKCFVKVEFGIGAISCLPGGNLAAATIRGFLSSAQIIGGGAGAAINYGRSMFKSHHEAKQLENSAKKCMEYVGHGMLNSVRASAELIGAGPILFVGYDLTRMTGLHEYRVIDFAKSYDYHKLNVFAKIDKISQRFETFLGLVSIVPGAYAIGAATRGTFGTAQVIGGFVGYLANRGASFIVFSEEKAAELKARSFKCGEYAAHGLCNIVRAPLEAIGAGVILAVLYDLTAFAKLHNKVINYKPLEYFKNPVRFPQPETGGGSAPNSNAQQYYTDPNYWTQTQAQFGHLYPSLPGGYHAPGGYPTAVQ